MSGRTIRVYLVDGVPGGVLTAEIINWTGQVLTAPRSRLADLATRKETKRTGVYVLSGLDPNTGGELVYIGESDNVFERLKQHDADTSKDFWERLVLVTSKDENLTKAHARHLESHLITLAADAHRAKLTNDTKPEPSSLPESDRADMDFFLHQVQLVLPVLGYSFLQPSQFSNQPGRVNGLKKGSPVFTMNPVSTSATAQEIDGEFVVFAGSTARKSGTESWQSYRSLRDQLITDGKLVPDKSPDLLRFVVDVPFASPSAAAAIIFAGNQNGRIAWRIRETGQSYKEWQEAKIALQTTATTTE